MKLYNGLSPHLTSADWLFLEACTCSAVERFSIDLCASLRAETKRIPASHIPRAHVLLCIYSDLTKVIRKDYLEQVDDLIYLSFNCMSLRCFTGLLQEFVMDKILGSDTISTHVLLCL